MSVVLNGLVITFVQIGALVLLLGLHSALTHRLFGSSPQ
jgi:hypothetical protein